MNTGGRKHGKGSLQPHERQEGELSREQQQELEGRHGRHGDSPRCEWLPLTGAAVGVGQNTYPAAADTQKARVKG